MPPVSGDDPGELPDVTGAWPPTLPLPRCVPEGPLLDPGAGEPPALLLAATEAAGAMAITGGFEARAGATFSAPAIDSPAEGSSGSGAGLSRGKPGRAKIATNAKLAAAVSPRRAKPVARIRSVIPCPARLDHRTERRRACRRIEFTSS